MRSLVINGQAIPIPDTSAAPYCALNHYCIPVGAIGVRISIQNIHSDIAIKQHDDTYFAIIDTNDPHVSCLNQEISDYIRIDSRLPKLPDPTDDHPIVFPITPAEAHLTVQAGSTPLIPVDIVLENVTGDISIDDLYYTLHIENCPNCNIQTHNSSLRKLTGSITGTSQLEISQLHGDIDLSLHDNSGILVHSGEIRLLTLATYGSSFANIKAPVTELATISNAGIYNIHLAKAPHLVIPALTGTGDIIIDEP